ncbi:maleylpyruvate isomerase family mycothiol-dependent enzyme [Amycolatopsis minnesotensis]|uniref:Maleylpyruvate isomerase family mycothiol-dependent enzyme n=1 Tax=Amycolatopsis minnesotensis TaxID=337894 RepID=A0ABP5DGM9_9PSEU
MTMKDLAREERADLAAFLATLTPEQWDHETLCEGWRVRDVVAHMTSYEELGFGGVLATLVKGRFQPGRINEVALARYRTRTPEELLAFLNAHLEPKGFSTLFGGMIGLVDGFIHHQDIRRPLGLPREMPEERLKTVLSAALKAPPVGAGPRARGLHLVAIDVDWTNGTGPEVRGTGEAILMAIAGRRGAVEGLSGPGQPTLASRIG